MITVTKPKIPRHLSYVLKTSMLETALAEAGIDCTINLHYWTPKSSGSILQAYLWLPNEYFDHTRIWVRAGAVPAAERKEAAEHLAQEALPAFVQWLGQLLKLPDNSPVLFQSPSFDATWNKGKIDITQTPT